jgi:ribosomal protein S12 methylthiotransferase
VSDNLLQVMATRQQVCHYLDLPLQHAHPDVLRRMRRPADAEAVLGLINRARQAMPDLALRTAFIVGFPGETEAEFEALLAFVREARLDHVGAFAYSREEGTPAFEMASQVPEEVKVERRDRLLSEQQAISLERNRAFVGQELDVLIEGAGDGVSVGRTYRDAPEVDGLAIVQGEMPAGEFVRCRVTRAMEYDLLLEPLTRGRDNPRLSPRRRHAGRAVSRSTAAGPRQRGQRHAS